MKLYIKYMTGLPCKASVKAELDRLKIPYVKIDIGVVELPNDLSARKREKLKKNLISYQLILYSTKKGILFEKIKDAIEEMVGYPDGHPVISYSLYLSVKLGYDYTYLANIFSEVSGISIRQYIILCKIEKVKPLVTSGQVSLSKISFQLHYSSVAHLSGQFKKITGLSPSCYRLITQQREELIKKQKGIPETLMSI